MRRYRRMAWLVLVGAPLCLALAAAAIRWIPERGELQRWSFVVPFSTAIMLVWEGWHCPRRWWLLRRDSLAGWVEIHAVDQTALAELEADRSLYLGTYYVEEVWEDEDGADEGNTEALSRPPSLPERGEVLPYSRLLWTQDGEEMPWRRSG